MLLQSKIALGALLLPESVAAFVPSALLDRPRSLVRLPAKQWECVCAEDDPLGKPLPQVLPGVDLPSPADIPKEIDLPFTNTRVNLFLDGAQPVAIGTLGGRPKSVKAPGMLIAEQNMINSQKLASQIPNPGYKFFGNGEHAKNLGYLLKTNPFFATALTKSEDGKFFELQAFNQVDPTASGKDATLFQQFMSCLGGGAGHRVNIQFNTDMSVNKVEVFDEVRDRRTLIILPNEVASRKELVDKWASSALYNLVFYASCVHANIHVLHYILTAALDFSSRDCDAMNQWAKYYAANIPEKYKQVSDLLIRGQPGIGEVLGAGNAGTVADTFAILTGSSGMGANGDKLIPILNKLLNKWVAAPADYIGGMMNLSQEEMKEGGILDEFMKHNDLLPAYASDVAGALRSSDGFDVAEERLLAYLERCSGLGSKIGSLEDWIKLMGATGITHGSTLSYSRLGSDPDWLRWRDIQSSTWGVADVGLMVKLLATICGMDKGRHALFSTTDVVGVPYEATLQAVLTEYNKKTNKLKEDYKLKIMEDEEEFLNYGWILSDFCPDGFDGKQLTVASYI